MKPLTVAEVLIAVDPGSSAFEITLQLSTLFVTVDSK